MRMALNAVILTAASVAATAQTTEGTLEPAERSWWSERLERLSGWAPNEALHDLERAVREREAALEDREAELEDREATVQKQEEAVRRHEKINRRRTTVLRHQADALRQRGAQLEEDVTKALLEAEQIRERSLGIAWAAIILGAGLGAWSLWRLQPSTVARLNQRRRAAEQNLASMQCERDEAQTQVRKKAAALTAAKRKSTLMQKAQDETAAKYHEAESAIAKLRSDLEDERRIKAWIGEARDNAEGRRREAEATITHLKAAITRLNIELKDAKRKTREAAGPRGTRECTARQILGVPAGASRNDVKAAWKRVARTVHPDHCPGPEANRLMQLANDALGWLKAA